MTDITEHNAQVVVYGEVATAADAAVEVVIPQLTALEGAVAVCNGTDNEIALKVAVSGITLTITPASTVGDTEAVYDIIAWGY